MGMDVSTTLAQIAASLPVDERLFLVEAIWDTIAAEPNQPELTAAQRQELERRLAAHAASPENVVPWEQVKAEALARRRVLDGV
jgi:putative addiction module component (TIGR02574 family)